MQIIRFELAGTLNRRPGQTAKALAGSSINGLVDGDDANTITVYDAWGVFAGRPGRPGVRGSVGYAVWMPDANRFEILSLQQ